MALKGREIQLKMEQFLHYPKREQQVFQVILFSNKVQVPYREIESWTT